MFCLFFLSLLFLLSIAQTDPSKADQWLDDIFPYRPQSQWNISSSAYAYPRTLNYTVTEGTWLRLDVHPISSAILFDMVGTLFCLPSTGGTAVPIFAPSVAYDTEPRFSPDGSHFLYRSDDGIGIDNIWLIPFTGCHEHGRWTARQVTNETFRYVSAARFHPSGRRIIASKWYTSTVTVGAPEAWLYSLDNAPSVGERVIGREESTKGESYGESQIGPEQALWASNSSLIYLRNVRDTFHIDNAGSGIFDVHKGTLGMFMRNLNTSLEQVILAASVNRPELSRDGRSLAFVRRDRDHEALFIKDLKTGTINQIYDDLTYDAAVLSSLQGSYPSYAFTPNDDSIIIWYSGHIHRIPLSVNAFGERTSSSEPTVIPFNATITKLLANTRKTKLDIRDVEWKERQKVHAMRGLRIDDSSSYAIVDAGGVTALQSLSSTTPATEVPVLHPSNPYYTPSFLPSSTTIVHVRWDDTNYTTFEIASATEAWEIEGIPKGRYHSPTISRDHTKMVFVKTAGDIITGYTKHTAQPGLYIVDLTRAMSKAENMKFIPSSISFAFGLTHMRFLSNSLLLVQQNSRAFTISLDTGTEEVLATGSFSNEILLASNTGNIAFLEYHHIYVLQRGVSKRQGLLSHFLSSLKLRQPPTKPIALWAKPNRSTPGIARTSFYGGHDLIWSADGETLYWLLGPTINYVHIPSLFFACSEEVKNDVWTFGIDCVHEKGLVKSIDIDISFSSFQEPEEKTKDLLITNATILTMHTGSPAEDLVKNGSMLISSRGVILDISSSSSSSTSDVGDDYEVLDAEGGFVLPGFIDAHAHWGGYTSVYPASSWELLVFLAYGVTTVHNPSSDTVTTALERTRLQRGFALGPRVFTTGTVLFGSSWVGVHEEIVDMKQAKEALMRIKLEMGDFTLSYKNYQLPSRASRQRLLMVAQELGMLCIPEGGGNMDWDITYILDGMTTMEHSLPVPVLYDDIRILWAASGTGSTPTHVVNYGGPFGEQIVWAEHDLAFDSKLRQYIPYSTLESITESYARPANSYAIKNTSISTAKMVLEGGLKVHIGAHGEQPKGFNFHSEMHFTHIGGLSKYNVFQAATIWAAQTLGLDDAIGSLAPGKMADFIIFRPGVDLLDESVVGGTKEIRYVGKGGTVWDPEKGMEEVWPVKGRRKVMPNMNP